VSDATIQRLGTTNPLTHFFRQSDGGVGNTRTFTAAGSATGIGDLTVRLKGLIRQTGRVGTAVGIDFHLPTGDELNLLGTGAAGIQPFVIVSASTARVSPHVNASYQWNGSSVLAGDPATGRSANFPDQATYALGADVVAGGRVTLAFDILGRYIRDAERIQVQEFQALDGVSVFPDIVFTRQSFNELNGSTGAKINLFNRVLLDVNLLFALDDHGVRDKVTPLIGLEYSF
jgi:hypothetical protein